MTPQELDRVEELKQLDRITLAVRLMRAEDAWNEAIDAALREIRRPAGEFGYTFKELEARVEALKR